MCNMKALSLLVRKLWPRFKFFKSRSNFKVKVTRSKIMVPCVKARLHYQSFLVQENLVKVFDANFDSVNGQRKL